MSVDVANQIRTGLDRLRTHGWIKRSVVNNKGERCAVGALLEYPTDHHLIPLDKIDPLVLKRIAEVIRELFPQRCPDPGFIYPTAEIVRFNNHDDTTFEDVEMVFEKAAIREEELI